MFDNNLTLQDRFDLGVEYIGHELGLSYDHLISVYDKFGNATRVYKERLVRIVLTERALEIEYNGVVNLLRKKRGD